MHTYLASFILVDIKNDEREEFEIPILTKDQSLSEVESFISEYALSMYATYIIKNIRYLGYPHKSSKLK